MNLPLQIYSLMSEEIVFIFAGGGNVQGVFESLPLRPLAGLKKYE